MTMTDKIPDVLFILTNEKIQYGSKCIDGEEDYVKGDKYYSDEYVEQLLARQREACAEAANIFESQIEPHPTSYLGMQQKAILNARIEDE